MPDTIQSSYLTECSPGGGQQLVARLKKTSKYWGQTPPHQWFDVQVVNDPSYRLRGNDNNYRLSDVVLGVRLGSDTIVDLVSGRTCHGR